MDKHNQHDFLPQEEENQDLVAQLRDIHQMTPQDTQALARLRQRWYHLSGDSSRLQEGREVPLTEKRKLAMQVQPQNDLWNERSRLQEEQNHALIEHPGSNANHWSLERAGEKIRQKPPRPSWTGWKWVALFLLVTQIFTAGLAIHYYAEAVSPTQLPIATPTPILKPTPTPTPIPKSMGQVFELSGGHSQLTVNAQVQNITIRV